VINLVIPEDSRPKLKDAKAGTRSLVAKLQLVIARARSDAQGGAWKTNESNDRDRESIVVNHDFEYPTVVKGGK